MKVLTVYATLIEQAIGHGFILRVPTDGSEASLVDRYSDFGKPPEHWVAHKAIGPLLASGVAELTPRLHKLEKERQGQRLGWQDLGVDGDKASLYCLVQ